MRAPCDKRPDIRETRLETTMKPPPMKLSDLKPARATETYAPPTPKKSRQKPGKVLTAAEKAAFLASRPDLKS
jgi:hypothetical protein